MAYKELKLEPGEARGLRDLLSEPPTKKKPAPAGKPRKTPAKKPSSKK